MIPQSITASLGDVEGLDPAGNYIGVTATASSSGDRAFDQYSTRGIIFGAPILCMCSRESPNIPTFSPSLSLSRSHVWHIVLNSKYSFSLFTNFFFYLKISFSVNRGVLHVYPPPLIVNPSTLVVSQNSTTVSTFSVSLCFGDAGLTTTIAAKG